MTIITAFEPQDEAFCVEDDKVIRATVEAVDIKLTHNDLGVHTHIKYILKPISRRYGGLLHTTEKLLFREKEDALETLALTI